MWLSRPVGPVPHGGGSPCYSSLRLPKGRHPWSVATVPGLPWPFPERSGPCEARLHVGSPGPKGEVTCSQWLSSPAGERRVCAASTGRVCPAAPGTGAQTCSRGDRGYLPLEGKDSGSVPGAAGSAGGWGACRHPATLCTSTSTLPRRGPVLPVS